LKVEIRSDHILLDGYVNAVGRDIRPIPDRRGEFVEQVVPGAFAQALNKGRPVELKLNHERVLGGTATGELELFEDAIGLRAKAKVTDAAVIEKARQKKLLSFLIYKIAQKIAEFLEEKLIQGTAGKNDGVPQPIYLGGLDLVHADQLQILVLVCHKNAPFRFDF